MRKTFRLALKAVDPEAVTERGRTVIKQRIYKTKGLHEVYHIDDNDELKLCGFYIMEPSMDSAERFCG